MVIFTGHYHYIWTAAVDMQMVNLPVTFAKCQNQKGDFGKFRKLTGILFTVRPSFYESNGHPREIAVDQLY